MKPDVILSCVTPGVFHCTRCPGGLFFSEKCNACMKYLNGKYNLKFKVYSLKCCINSWKSWENLFTISLYQWLILTLSCYFYHLCIGIPHQTYKITVNLSIIWNAMDAQCYSPSSLMQKSVAVGKQVGWVELCKLGYKYFKFIQSLLLFQRKETSVQVNLHHSQLKTLFHVSLFELKTYLTTI